MEKMNDSAINNGIQVSFPDKCILSFKQKKCFAQNALVLADVDNDSRGDIELTVGGIGGELAIYKYNNVNPWKMCDGLGTISCLSVGDLRGEGKNSLIVLSGEGFCYLFDISADEDEPVIETKSPIPKQHNSDTNLKPSLKTTPSTTKTKKKVHFEKIPTKEREWFTEVIEPSFSHGVTYNACVALIADVDEDKKNELIVGTSSREVHTYSLVRTGPNNDILCLQQKRKYLMTSKIHSLSFYLNDWGRAQLFVGQVSDDLFFMKMDHKENFKIVNLARPHSETKSNNPDEPRIGRVPCPVEVKRIGRPSLSVGNLTQSPNLLGMISLDGSISLIKDDKVCWTINSGKQLFGLEACDITEDGYDEMVFSSWDGKTYIIDQNMRCVEFQFEDQFSGFTSGLFSISPGQKTPCLVYGTFFEELYIYYNISHPVKHALQRKIKGEEAVPEGTEGMTYGELLKYKEYLKSQLEEEIQ